MPLHRRYGEGRRFARSVLIIARSDCAEARSDLAAERSSVACWKSAASCASDFLARSPLVILNMDSSCCFAPLPMSRVEEEKSVCMNEVHCPQSQRMWRRLAGQSPRLAPITIHRSDITNETALQGGGRNNCVGTWRCPKRFGRAD